MNILINIAKYILPFIVRFLDKHGDEWLEKFYSKVGKILDERESSTLKVETNVGAYVEVDVGGKVVGKVAEDGIATFSGVCDKAKVTVSRDGYVTQSEEVDGEEIVFMGLERIKDGSITSIEEAKADYKELESFVEKQRDIVESSLMSGAYDVAQAEGAKLMSSVRNRLNKSMGYYVEIRGKLNPLGSWTEFRDYCECTSMIASIYFMRKSLVEWFDGIMKKIDN